MRTSDGTEGIFAVCRGYHWTDPVHGMEMKGMKKLLQGSSLQEHNSTLLKARKGITKTLEAKV